MTTTTTMMMRALYVLLLATGSAVHATAMTDPATGIAFRPKLDEDLNLFGVGVRKKGPIKIYAVGLYGPSRLTTEWSSLSRTAQKDAALTALQKDTGSSEEPVALQLQMAFKVGAEKMASAVADSVAPRCDSPAAVAELQELIQQGVATHAGGAATKGTILEFQCSATDGVQVSVNGKAQGSVNHPQLAQAFCNVYLDDKSVSPTLRQSCLENCFGA